MALNEVLGLLLPVAWHDLTQVISLPQAAVALQCQSVSAGPAPWPASRGTLASLLVADSRHGLSRILMTR